MTWMNYVKIISGIVETWKLKKIKLLTNNFHKSGFTDIDTLSKTIVLEGSRISMNLNFHNRKITGFSLIQKYIGKQFQVLLDLSTFGIL